RGQDPAEEALGVLADGVALRLAVGGAELGGGAGQVEDGDARVRGGHDGLLALPANNVGALRGRTAAPPVTPGAARAAPPPRAATGPPAAPPPRAGAAPKPPPPAGPPAPPA